MCHIVYHLNTLKRYMIWKRAEEMIQTSQESYNRRWFHTGSWHGRPRRATYWCTCGRGRSLGVSNRNLCAVRRSIAPSPLSFCFRVITDRRREERTEKGDMRNNHVGKCSLLTFPANNGPKTQRRQILALPRPRLVLSLSLTPLARSFSLWYTISNYYSVRTRRIQMAEATASCNSLTQMICS